MGSRSVHAVYWGVGREWCVVCVCVCGWGGVPLGWRGVRVGEAANPRPYTVGHASSSGEMPAGALSAEIREDQTLPSVGIWGHLGKTQEDGLGMADAAWWDLHGMRVGESWALLHQGAPNEEGAQTAELREKLWEEYERRREEARGSEAGHGLAEGMRKEEGYITEEFRRRIEVNRLRAIERRKLKELRSKKVEGGVAFAAISADLDIGRQGRGRTEGDPSCFDEEYQNPCEQWEEEVEVEEPLEWDTLVGEVELLRALAMGEVGAEHKKEEREVFVLAKKFAGKRAGMAFLRRGSVGLGIMRVQVQSWWCQRCFR